MRPTDNELKIRRTILIIYNNSSTLSHQHIHLCVLYVICAMMRIVSKCVDKYAIMCSSIFFSLSHSIYSFSFLNSEETGKIACDCCYYCNSVPSYDLFVFEINLLGFIQCSWWFFVILRLTISMRCHQWLLFDQFIQVFKSHAQLA